VGFRKVLLRCLPKKKHRANCHSTIRGHQSASYEKPFGVRVPNGLGVLLEENPIQLVEFNTVHGSHFVVRLALVEFQLSALVEGELPRFVAHAEKDLILCRRVDLIAGFHFNDHQVVGYPELVYAFD
jgi:hypothetical protein